MLVSLDSRLAFLAMPKTGTQSLEKALKPLCGIQYGGTPRAKHMSARMFERHMRPYLKHIGADDTETVCVIREPVDWLGSWYRYRQRKGIANKKKSTRDMSFPEFVESYLETPQPRFAKIGSIAQFVADKSGRQLVKHMFRYDNMPALTNFLSERFGKRITLPRVNVSPKRDELLLPAALRSRLEVERQADFEIYSTLTG